MANENNFKNLINKKTINEFYPEIITEKNSNIFV